MSLIENENAQANDAWNRNAEFWNECMGEGNDFFNILLWPAVERLLKPQPGERLLDVACGNGLTSRRLATAKARVTAFDISAAMIAIAAGHPGLWNIDYRVVDATNREALLDLGAGAFDGAVCNMALMDMAEIEPLMTALAVLLKPGGRFVLSVLHPCFNNPATVQMGELEDRNGTIVTTYSVKIALQNALHASWARDARPTRSASLLPSTSQLVAGTGAQCRLGARRLRGTGLPSRQLWWHHTIVLEWPFQ